MTRNRKILTAAAAAAVLAAVAAATWTPAGPSDSFRVVFTKEIRGHIVPCGCYFGQPGGIARIPAALGRDFDTHRSILVDAGDFVGNTPMRGFDPIDGARGIPPAKKDYLLRKHEALARAMGSMGFAAVCPGETDFILGQRFLLEGIRNAPGAEPIWRGAASPIVCANIVAPGGGNVFPPFRIVRTGAGSIAGLRYGGVRVGIMGIVAANVQIPQSDDDMYQGLQVAPEEQPARETVDKIRAAGADAVVMLFHGRWDDAVSLMKRVPGIALAVVGHGGGSRPPLAAGDGYVVQVGGGGVEVGVAAVRLDGFRAVEIGFDRRVLEPKLPEDEAAMRPYREFQAELAAAPLPPPNVAQTGEFAGSASCSSCHEPQWKQWKSTPHSSAWETLLDRGHSGDPECLQCHTTGYGDKTGFSTFPATPLLAGVGCETCHGPRAEHALSQASKIAAGAILPKPAARPGSFIPGCVKCHDEGRDPGFKNNLEKRFERIRHGR